MQACNTCDPQNPCGIVNIIQGYAKTFQVDLYYADTGEPYDLTGQTQIKVGLPSILSDVPIIESLSSFTATGNTIINTNQITNLSSISNIVVGLPITGSGIPAGTYVIDISGTTLTISQNATATANTVLFTFGNTNVTVVGPAGAGKIQVVLPAIDSLNVLLNPNPLQYQDLIITVLNSLGVVDAFLLQAVLNVQSPGYKI